MFNRKKGRPDDAPADQEAILIDDDDIAVVKSAPAVPAIAQPVAVQAPAVAAPDTQCGTVVGPGVVLEGTLQFTGVARVDGTVRGRVVSPDRLDVGPDAEVVAELDVGELVLRGSVEGNVSARRGVEIHATGKLRGDLCTEALTVHEGALFHGHCNMGGE